MSLVFNATIDAIRGEGVTVATVGNIILGSDAEPGDLIDGVTNADTGWLCINDSGSDVINTDALVYRKMGGNVSGPVPSVDNSIARFDGAYGDIQSSGLAIDDSDRILFASLSLGATIPDLAGIS